MFILDVLFRRFGLWFFFYPTWGLVPILFSDVSPLQFRSNLHQPWLMKSPAKLASNCNNEVSCVEHCWHVYQTGMFFRRAQKGFAGVRLSGKQPVGLLFQGFDPPWPPNGCTQSLSLYTICIRPYTADITIIQKWDTSADTEMESGDHLLRFITDKLPGYTTWPTLFDGYLPRRGHGRMLRVFFKCGDKQFGFSINASPAHGNGM